MSGRLTIPDDLAARVRAYAQDRAVSLADAASDLIDAGLRARDSQQAAGAARWRGVDPQTRRQIASDAAKARWKARKRREGER